MEMMDKGKGSYSTLKSAEVMSSKDQVHIDYNIVFVKKNKNKKLPKFFSKNGRLRWPKLDL